MGKGPAWTGGSRANSWTCPTDPLIDYETYGDYHYDGYYHLVDDTRYRTSYAYHFPFPVVETDQRLSGADTGIYGLYDYDENRGRSADEIRVPATTLAFLCHSVNASYTFMSLFADHALELRARITSGGDYGYHYQGTAVPVSAVDGHVEAERDLVELWSGEYTDAWRREPYALQEHWYNITE